MKFHLSWGGVSVLAISTNAKNIVRIGNSIGTTIGNYNTFAGYHSGNSNAGWLENTGAGAY
jgi:hypothetical protein